MPLTEEEVLQRVQAIRDSDLELRIKFEAWFKRNGMINYGPAQMSECYNNWRGGYLVALCEK